MTYLPSSINIVILESVISGPSNRSLPPTTINHTHCGPIIIVDRE